MAHPPKPPESREPTLDELLAIMHADERQFWEMGECSPQQRAEFSEGIKARWRALQEPISPDALPDTIKPGASGDKSQKYSLRGTPPSPKKIALSPMEDHTAPSRTTRALDPYRLIKNTLAGKYKLLTYAGSGGMGVVYKAENVADQKIVAVKILKPDMVARNPEYVELFEKEVKIVQGLRHPHIVEVLDNGKDDDLSFMVMEWIEGKSIEDVIAQKQLSLSSIINIFEQICSAIAFAHERKIIHLDIKPGNILLLEDRSPDEFVKVIDFGLARVVSKESGTTVTRFRGTHQYCAPEQFGGKVSHRSDIYSLGVTLYYLLTGVIPFGASYINAKIYPNLELPEIPSVVRQRNLPLKLDNVIKKALNKNPALRQRSAKQLLKEFKDALSPTQKSRPQEIPTAEVQAAWANLEIKMRQRSEQGVNERTARRAGIIGIIAFILFIGLITYFGSNSSSTISSQSPTFVPKSEVNGITGRILSPRGMEVGHMFVTISGENKERLTTTTGVTGTYYIPNITPGRYRLETYKPDYARTTARRIRIEDNKITTLTILLRPSDMISKIKK
jgi:serine/threonine protein kinase